MVSCSWPRPTSTEAAGPWRRSQPVCKHWAHGNRWWRRWWWRTVWSSSISGGRWAESFRDNENVLFTPSKHHFIIIIIVVFIISPSFTHFKRTIRPFFMSHHTGHDANFINCSISEPQLIWRLYQNKLAAVIFRNTDLIMTKKNTEPKLLLLLLRPCPFLWVFHTNHVLLRRSLAFLLCRHGDGFLSLCLIKEGEL